MSAPCRKPSPRGGTPASLAQSPETGLLTATAGEVKKQAKQHDLVWVTLMGNDALEEMPGCAKQGKTAAECGDVLMTNVLGYMSTILDGIHEANPSAKVVGFGYDTMFGGLGCSLLTRDSAPAHLRSASYAAIACARLAAALVLSASPRPMCSLSRHS